MDLVYQWHVYVSLILIGLIWTVQLVHYPSFFYVEEKRFKEFTSYHGFWMSVLVIPLMCYELASIVLLNLVSFSYLYFINLVIVSLIWLSTFLVSVPCHMKLEKTKDFSVIQRLVKTNWIRTILWTAKLGLFIY